MYHFYWKHKGFTWLQYYSHRLNKPYKVDNLKSIYQSKSYTKYIDDVRNEVEMIKKNGLKPSHSFLDYGCGSLRFGFYLINFLEPNKYVGVDLSQTRLNLGREHLQHHNILPECYTTFVVKDCLLRELDNYKFDFVWANSVFTHMTQEDISQMLLSLKRLLSPKGKFLFTFSHSISNGTQGDTKIHKATIIGKDFYYTEAEMKSICNKAGYTFRVLHSSWPVSISALAQVTLRDSHNSRS